ncbi:aldo/keto reductase [Eubacteriales bacterium OttesenSCG-928-M02]|nr:aldo/keto reductase [Eubacteriales bacterium OttesenSCG-928-M02]
MQIPVTKLHDGVDIPMIGFGTWQIPEGPTCADIVAHAIKVGYPSIDTATAYKNEKSVGEGIQNGGVPREQLFITTKLWNDDQGYDSTLKAFDASMEKLGLSYLDLYLIHWPGKDRYLDTWKAFIRLKEDGRIRSIGVSNFLPAHLDVIINETGVVPSVNQLETHPYLHQKEALIYCKEKGILVETWSPLMSGKEALSDPTIAEIAKAYGKTPAQVILRWHVQNGFRVIPKSITPKRVEENIQIFDFALSQEDMERMNALTEKNIRSGRDPMEFLF